MEEKYWSNVNFIGHFDTISKDAEVLLRRIGAWQKHGRIGWGTHNTTVKGTKAIFQKDSNTVGHQTNAKSNAADWLTPELEKRIEDYYAIDYDNPLFGFTRKSLLSSASSDSKDEA